MLALQLILADGVTIHLGDNVWTFDTKFIIYLIVAAVVGFVAEALVGRRLPFGFVGAIIAALVGAWLLTKVIILTRIGVINVAGIPLLTSQGADRRNHPGGSLASPDIPRTVPPPSSLLSQGIVGWTLTRGETGCKTQRMNLQYRKASASK